MCHQRGSLLAHVVLFPETDTSASPKSTGDASRHGATGAFGISYIEWVTAGWPPLPSDNYSSDNNSNKNSPGLWPNGMLDLQDFVS